jgi:AraC-like DNA-binding protein
LDFGLPAKFPRLPLLYASPLPGRSASIIGVHDQRKQGSGGTEVSPTIEIFTATIKENLRQPPTVEQLARQSKMSETSFRKIFRNEIGSSPLDYINRRGVFEARRLLEEKDLNIKEVAHPLGFFETIFFNCF